MTLHISEKAGRAGEILVGIGALGCNLEKPYQLASGRASPVQVDCRKLMSFVNERREMLWLMAEAVRTEPFDVVAGGATAGISYGAWLAELVGLPFVYLRPEPEGAGTRREIEGELKPGQKVLLVDDLATDGGPKAEVLDALRGAGAVCEHAVVVLYSGILPQAVQDAGITLHAMTTWRHLIDAADRNGYLPSARIKGIREFLENPEAWSKAHGGT